MRIDLISYGNAWTPDDEEVALKGSLSISGGLHIVGSVLEAVKTLTENSQRNRYWNNIFILWIWISSYIGEVPGNSLIWYSVKFGRWRQEVYKLIKQNGFAENQTEELSFIEDILLCLEIMYKPKYNSPFSWLTHQRLVCIQKT